MRHRIGTVLVITALLIPVMGETAVQFESITYPLILWKNASGKDYICVPLPEPTKEEDKTR